MKLILSIFLAVLLLGSCFEAQAVEVGPGAIRHVSAPASASLADAHTHSGRGPGITDKESHGIASVPLVHDTAPHTLPGVTTLNQKPKISLHGHRTALLQSATTDTHALRDASADSVQQSNHAKARQQFFAPLQITKKGTEKHTVQTKPIALLQRATLEHAHSPVGKQTVPLTAPPLAAQASPLKAKHAPSGRVNATGKHVNATAVGGIFHRFSDALVSHWQQHGILGSVYGVEHAVQPSILLGLLLVLFIGAQLAALAFVACHAHASMKMLRTARAPCPQRSSRKWELIPGISWADCVPYDNKDSSHAASPSNSSLNQRRPKDSSVPGSQGHDDVFGHMARQGWAVWTSKQRNQYMLSPSDGGGQAANKARLQEMLTADRQAGTLACQTKQSKEALEKNRRATGEPALAAHDDTWDALESTIAVATRRADMNQRILDLLQHQSPKSLERYQASLGAMLDSEYDAMFQSDLESNLTPGLTRRDSIRSPFAC